LLYLHLELTQNYSVRYERVWGWKDSTKWQELTDDDARFIVVKGTVAGKEGEQLLGFVHLRFEVYEEDGEETLYVYGIFICACLQLQSAL